MTTADYYRNLDKVDGAIERHDHPRPTDPEAIKERRKAIREGRLVSIPRDEQALRTAADETAEAVDCAGCFARTPKLNDERLLLTPTNPPGTTLQNHTFEVHPVPNNADALFFHMDFDLRDGADVIDVSLHKVSGWVVNGSCHEVSGNCEEDDPCSLALVLEFLCSSNLPPGSLPALFSVDTSVSTAQDCAPQNVVDSVDADGNPTGGSAFLLRAQIVVPGACGASTEVEIEQADIAVACTGWSAIAPTNPQSSLVFGINCSQCR